MCIISKKKIGNIQHKNVRISQMYGQCLRECRIDSVDKETLNTVIPK